MIAQTLIQCVAQVESSKYVRLEISFTLFKIK